MRWFRDRVYAREHHSMRAARDVGKCVARARLRCACCLSNADRTMILRRVVNGVLRGVVTGLRRVRLRVRPLRAPLRTPW